MNILIKPQHYHEKDTAAKWYKHINHTLNTNPAFAQQTGKIFLLERADNNTNTDTIIASNPQIIHRPTHSTLHNHVHRVYFINTPTHEGEWTGDRVGYARAIQCHKYLIHEFQADVASAAVPPITVFPTEDMGDTTDDDASQATMCSHTPTQITVLHQTANTARAAAAKLAIKSHDIFPTQVTEIYTTTPGHVRYTIDAPMADHDKIINHLNSHMAGITAMPEAQFQGAGIHGPDNHYTLITRRNAAGNFNALTITNFLATQGENDDHPSPARAYTTSPHTIHIATPTPPDGIREALDAHRNSDRRCGIPLPRLLHPRPRTRGSGAPVGRAGDRQAHPSCAHPSAPRAPGHLLDQPRHRRHPGSHRDHPPRD